MSVHLARVIESPILFFGIEMPRNGSELFSSAYLVNFIFMLK